MIDSTNTPEPTSYHSDLAKYFSQIHIIHDVGVSIFSNSYKSTCTNIDPQLLGGFLAAISTFASSHHGSGDLHGKGIVHRLTDIGVGCSRWFLCSIETKERSYIIALLIPNESPIMKVNDYSQIYEVLNEIGFRLLFQTSEIHPSHISSYEQLPDSFKNEIDSLLSKHITEIGYSI